MTGLDHDRSWIVAGLWLSGTVILSGDSNREHVPRDREHMLALAIVTTLEFLEF